MKLNKPGSQHLLDIESLTQQRLESLIRRSIQVADEPEKYFNRLAGKTLINLFLEPSTRTRISFELAAKHLGMHVINFQTNSSSSVKGEDLFDTFHTLQAMQPDVIAIRHSEDNIVAALASESEAGIHVINAGDGCSHHPTQALLDAVTLMRVRGALEGANIAIVGDIIHSRVAQSDIAMFKKMGVASIRLAGPVDLLPAQTSGVVKLCADPDEALSDADVVIMLRIQRERFGQSEAPEEGDYFKTWGLTPKRMLLTASDCLVMHPGPVNRGVEIASEIADGPQSMIRAQVRNAVYTRMAVLMALVSGE
jgi:aspartate carbamoyltransferase catalytic subunit